MAWLHVFSRVPGGRVASVEATFTTLFQRDSAAALSPDATDEDRAGIARQRVTLGDASTGLSNLRTSVSQPLYVLFAMVGVLLAIACGNVAGLLLSRAAGRGREMAIRQSIGAGRLRLVRQMFAESLVLALAGGFVGFTFAIWTRDALLALMVNVGTSGAPPDLDTGLDARVFAFSILVSAATGIGCGFLPAFRGTRVPVSETLRQDGRGAVGEGGRRGLLVGKTLVAVQMAFCLLLLVVAALFSRSFSTLMQSEIGFDRARVLTVRADVLGAGYGAEERQALYGRLITAVESIPGVESASMSRNGPLGGSQQISSLSVEGYTAGRDQQLRTNEEAVTDRYFDTMGLKILEGRGFRAEDRAPGAKNTLINATMARRFFKGQSAIGKRWDYGDAVGKDSFRVVGVVEDARYVELKQAPPNMAYHLAAAMPDTVLRGIEVRTAGEPSALVQTVRDTLARVEPRLPIIEIVPLEERLARGLIQDRMVARLTAMFGGLALLLACLGLYGTISYGISRRVAEIGLRMALGADQRSVRWLVLREALMLVAAGVAIGLPLAFLAGRTIGTLLFGVPPGDPIAFSVGVVLLVAVAAVAAYVPAARASRIEPMAALSR
jgi:predicted permease